MRPETLYSMLHGNVLLAYALTAIMGLPAPTIAAPQVDWKNDSLPGKDWNSQLFTYGLGPSAYDSAISFNLRRNLGFKLTVTPQLSDTFRVRLAKGDNPKDSLIKVLNGDNVIFKTKVGYFSFEPASSEYRFYNRSAKPFPKGKGKVDTIVARKTLNAILGAEESGRYELANTETSWRMDPSDKPFSKRKNDVFSGARKKPKPRPPILEFVDYRFVLNQDNRLVLGNNCHIRLELGAGDKVRSFSWKTPQLIDRKPYPRIPKPALKTILTQFVSENAIFRDPAGQMDTLISIRPLRYQDSYIPRRDNAKTNLIPALTLIYEARTTRDTAYIRQVSISELDYKLIPE